MTNAWPQGLVAVAEIVRPHGVRGQVKAMPLTGRAERFGALKTVTAWKNGSESRLTIASWRSWRDFVILGFTEITDMVQAESMRGALICIQERERAVLPPDRYYHDDLLGLAVVTDTGRYLGRVESIMAATGNDVLTVRGEDGREFLLPAVRAIIARVDLAAGELVVNLIPGLMD